MPPRHKPWIKVDADADESDKLAGLPNHNARWGWFRMMCRAKTQRRMGVFAGQPHLRQLLGAEGRYVPDMVRAGLLHVWPTDCGRCSADYAGDATADEIVVHDFRREQRDPTNAERQSRFRNGGHNANLTVDSRAVSPSMSLSPSENDDGEPYHVSTPPEANDLRALAEELTGITNVLANVWGGLGEKAVLLARKHGMAAVEREWRRIAAMERGMPTLRQLVLGADNALNQIVATKPMTDEQRKDAEIAAYVAAANARAAS